jgi:Mn-containing catalase
MMQDLLVEEMQDLLHAEGQLVKALPKMAKAANSDLLRMAFEKHLEETREQVDRLKQAFDLLGVAAKSKPCKGMAGLLEEGGEAIEDGGDKDDIAADLGAIASAQKVEHYEISAYGTSRALAGQIGRPDVARLLAQSLAEEENADNLLTQIARELMGQARTGSSKGPKLTALRDRE